MRIKSLRLERYPFCARREPEYQVFLGKRGKMEAKKGET